MIIKNLKIQMLAGNNLKMCVGAGFEISSTLEICIMEGENEKCKLSQSQTLMKNLELEVDTKMLVNWLVFTF